MHLWEELFSFDKEEQITDGVNAELSVNITHTTGWKNNSDDVDVAQQDLDEALTTSTAIELQKKQNEQADYQTDKPKFASKPEIKDPDVAALQEKPMFTKDVDKPDTVLTNRETKHDDQGTTSEDKPMATKDVGKADKVSTESEKEHPDQSTTVKDSKPSMVKVSEKREEKEEKTVSDGSKTIINKAVRKIKNCPEIEWCKDLILSIWDFAGQDLYYITHQVFLVSRAIYIICFNLCHGLDDYAEIEIHKLEHGKVTFEHHMTNIEFIFFWLRSTHSTTIQSVNRQQSPAVIIVGTHRESLPGNADEKLACANKKLKAIKEKLKGTAYEYLVDKDSYFAIDNSLRPVDKAIEELKTYITNLAKKQPYMGDEIPVKWLEFFAKVEQLRKTKSTIKFNEVEELAKACAIEDDALFIMLKFSHNLGYIVYYGEPDTRESRLNDLVILDRNWLIKIFRKVFTYIRDSEWNKFESSWKRLSTEGIMEEKLLKHLLAGPDEYDKQFESLLELMQEFHLLLEMPSLKEAIGTHKESCRLFYAPSLLGDKQKKVDKNDPRIKSVVMLYIGFEGFLSEGMFYRLLVMLLKWSQDKGGSTKLFHHQGQFSLDESHEMVLSLWSFKRTFIQVAILRHSSVEGDDGGETEPSPSICKTVHELLKEKLDNLFKTYRRKIDHYFFFLCNTCNKEKKLIECLKKDKIECEMAGMMSTKSIHGFFGGLELKQDDHLSTLGVEEGPTTSTKALSTVAAGDHQSNSEDKEQQSTSARAFTPKTTTTTESELITRELEIVMKPSQISTGVNVMDADGGFLTHGKTKLLIKPDALDEQEHVKISVKHCLHAEKIPHFLNLRSAVSPIVRCGPSRTFKEYCTLKLPHNVLNYKNCKFSLLWKEYGTNTWKVVSITDEDTKFTIEEGFCIIKTKHFSDFWLVVRRFFGVRQITSSFKMGLFGLNLPSGGRQIKAITWKLCDKETQEVLKDAIEPDEFSLGSIDQFSAVEYNDIKLKIEVTDGWVLDESEVTFPRFSPEGNTSHKCLLTATAEEDPKPCNVILNLKQHKIDIKPLKWYEIDAQFRKRRLSSTSEAHVKKQSHCQEEPSRSGDKHKFRSFLSKLSEQYTGKHFHWLRFLLSDFFPVSSLYKTDVNGMYLFNQLANRDLISCANVTILSDIVETTGLASAKHCVEAYKQETQCQEGEGMIHFRKNLFKGLMEVTDSEVHKLVAYYNLSHLDFNNVWDLVLYLQKEKFLDNTQEKWKTFTDSLNNTAKTKIIDVFGTETQ